MLVEDHSKKLKNLVFKGRVSFLSLKKRILDDIKSAMKNRQSEQLQSLKLVYAECKNKEIQLRTDITDIQMISILKKQVKQYHESIESYNKGGHLKNSQEQQRRLDFIKSYLPAPISETQLQSFIQKAITSVKATSLKDMKLVINTVQGYASGAADNSLLVKLIKERLQN